METNGHNDVQETERIFKKVVYPGLKTLRVVDRNGVQVNYPGINSFRSKTFILSPRGVPMKTTNHVYSGFHSHHVKVSEMQVTNGQAPENCNGHEKRVVTQGSYSAKLPRKRNESPHHTQKRATTSHSTGPKHVSKSISSDHFLTGEPSERHALKSANSNYWNLSNQGLRLQREWTSLSNSRSMKRASEIVNHRVDRMYFMSGNSIQLKPRYDVDDEELKRMREQQSRNSNHKRNVRTSSRTSNQSPTKKKETIDIQQKLENPESEATAEQTSSSELNLKKPDGTVSPIQGWDANDKAVTEENVIIRQKLLHEGDQAQNLIVTENGKDFDEENMRADGRIDSTAVKAAEEKEEIDTTKEQEQGETNEAKVEEGEIINGEEETNNDENVAQDNT